MIGQAANAFSGLSHATTSLKAKGFGDDAHSERAAFLGNFGNNWSGTSAGPATHANGNEDEIDSLQSLLQFCSRFLRRLLTDAGITASSQPPRKGLTQLHAVTGCRLKQGLSVRIHDPIVHTIEVTENHAVDGIAAASADANYFNAS